MKTTFRLSLFLGIFFQICYSQKQEPWHNHTNYKEEIIKSIKENQGFNKNNSFTPITNTNNSTPVSRNNNFQFINGINIAWVNYGRDIGRESNGTVYHPDMTAFSNIMDQVANAGGDVIRWWFHTNGSTNPVFDSNDDFVAPNPSFFATDLIAVLDLAASKGIKLQICLWSFDMLKGSQWNVNSARNKKILTQEAYLQAYLNNALLPLVNAVGNHPGLYAWEIFNEPEGMTLQYAAHWPDFTDRVTMTNIQWMINKTTAAIKTAQPNVKVTNGALGFVTGTTNSSNGYVNEYTDQKLIAAGGQANGVLDLYNIHYYDWAGTNGSPFHTPFVNTNLDKPTVIAEYYPINTFGVTAANLGTTLLQNGWSGSLVWSWTDRPWNEIEPVLLNLNSVLSISDFNTTKNITFYPNPVKDRITIEGLSKDTEFVITDLFGKILAKKTIGIENTGIDFSSFPNGIYILNFEELGINGVKIIKQ